MRFHLLVVAALCLQSSCASNAEEFISELVKLEGELERAKQVDHSPTEKPGADEEIEDGEQATVPFPVEDIELPEKRSKKSLNYNSGVCDDIKDNSPYKIICYMVTVGQSAPGYEGLAGVSHKGYSPPIELDGSGSVYGGPAQGYGAHSVPSTLYVPPSRGYGGSSSGSYGGYSGLTGGHSVSSPGTFQGYSGPITSAAHGLPGVSSGMSYGTPIGSVSGGSSSYGQGALGSSSGYGNPSASSGTSFGNGAAPGYSSSYGSSSSGYGTQGVLGHGQSLLNVPTHHGIISTSSHYKSMNSDDDSIAEASDDTMVKAVPSHGSEDMERSAYYPKIYPAMPNLPNLLPIHIPNYLKAPALPHLHYSKPCHASASSSEAPIYLKCLQSQSAPAHKPILVHSYGPTAHESNNNKYYGHVMLPPHLPQESLSYGSYGLGVPAPSQSLSYGHLLDSSSHGNLLSAPYYGQSQGGYSYRKAELTHQENKDHPTLVQAHEQQQLSNRHQNSNQQIHNAPSNIHQVPQMTNPQAMTMDHSQTQSGLQLANHRQQIALSTQQSGVHAIPEHLAAGINHGTQNSFNTNKPLGGQQQKSSQIGWERSMSGGNQFMRLSNPESVSMPRFVLVNQEPRMSTDQMLNNPQRASMDQGVIGQLITLSPQQMMRLNQRNQDFRFNMNPSMGSLQEPRSIDFPNQEFRLNNQMQGQMNPSMIPQHFPMTQQQQLFSNGRGNLHANHMQQPVTSDQAGQQHGQANLQANHPQKAMTDDQMIQGQGHANQKQQSTPSNHGDKPKAVEDISDLIHKLEKVNENEQKDVQAISEDQSPREVKSSRNVKKSHKPVQ